jgi:hypothetical protein
MDDESDGYIKSLGDTQGHKISNYLIFDYLNRYGLYEAFSNLNLEEIGDVQELDFLFTFCSYMEYFKVECTYKYDGYSIIFTYYFQEN